MKKYPPIFQALLIQCIAVVLVTLQVNLLQTSLSGTAFIFFTSVYALVLSYLFRLPRWWLWIQLLFLPTLMLVWSWQLPSWMFLSGFVLLLLIYWSNFRSQVPLYLSSPQVWQKLSGLLPKKNSQVIDLGCGLGGLLHYLAQHHPEAELTGVELAPLPYLYCKLRLRRYANCTILRQSLWHTPLQSYDVVFAYLSPVPMVDLWQKVQQEMPSGSLFVSCCFAVPNITPQQVIQLNDFDGAELFVYQIGEANK